MSECLQQMDMSDGTNEARDPCCNRVMVLMMVQIDGDTNL